MLLFYFILFAVYLAGRDEIIWPHNGAHRPVGRPRTTWLRTIDDDLQSLNFGVHTAWRKARDRDVWHQVVSTATLHPGVLYTPGGSTLWLWLGGRQEIGTFGIKSSVRQATLHPGVRQYIHDTYIHTYTNKFITRNKKSLICMLPQHTYKRNIHYKNTNKEEDRVGLPNQPVAYLVLNVLVSG